MLTNQEAKYLLDLEKVLTNPNQTIDLSDLIINFARRINLKSLINIQQAIL